MNVDKFRAAQFERRTATVKVPELSAFFDEGQKPELTVQNLTGPEVFEAEQRVSKNRNIEGLVKKLLKATPEKMDALLEGMGISDNVPDALVKAIAYCEFGIASADLQQQDIVRLAEYHVQAFLRLFNKINSLTGLGHVLPGESNASGTTPA